MTCACALQCTANAFADRGLDTLLMISAAQLLLQLLVMSIDRWKPLTNSLQREHHKFAGKNIRLIYACDRHAEVLGMRSRKFVICRPGVLAGHELSEQAGAVQIISQTGYNFKKQYSCQVPVKHTEGKGTFMYTQKVD